MAAAPDLLAPVAPQFEPVACMMPAELVLWDEANELVPHPAARPCADCQTAWARRMRTEGRCNGMPGQGQRA